MNSIATKQLYSENECLWKVYWQILSKLKASSWESEIRMISEYDQFGHNM